MQNQDEKEILEPVRLYEDSASKAENNRSSAYMLLVVGILGLALAVLGLFDVLPIRLWGVTKYLSFGVMGALFLLFIIMGVVSMKSYRFFRKRAESEKTLKGRMEDWSRENLTKEMLQELTEQEDSMEERYFKRTDYMKKRISDKFLNLDEGFLDDFVEERYDELFADEETDYCEEDFCDAPKESE